MISDHVKLFVGSFFPGLTPFYKTFRFPTEQMRKNNVFRSGSIKRKSKRVDLCQFGVESIGLSRLNLRLRLKRLSQPIILLRHVG